MSPRRLATAILSLATIAGAPASAFAQRDARPSYFEQHFSGSLGGWVMQPVGDLGANIGTGWGAGAAGLFRLDDRGLWSLRADLGLGGYGNKGTRVHRSEEHTSEIQSLAYAVCRLLL